MQNREVVLEFLRRFCDGDVDGLAPLLTADLTVRGALRSFASAAEYLASLRSDPPARCPHQVLSVTEGQDEVSVFYEYGKPDGSLLIAQLFRMRGTRIREMLIVFDGRGFS